jgi:hypothetical protein
MSMAWCLSSVEDCFIYTSASVPPPLWITPDDGEDDLDVCVDDGDADDFEVDLDADLDVDVDDGDDIDDKDTSIHTDTDEFDDDDTDDLDGDFDDEDTDELDDDDTDDLDGDVNVDDDLIVGSAGHSSTITREGAVEFVKMWWGFVTSAYVGIASAIMSVSVSTGMNDHCGTYSMRGTRSDISLSVMLSILVLSFIWDINCCRLDGISGPFLSAILGIVILQLK